MFSFSLYSSCLCHSLSAPGDSGRTGPNAESPFMSIPCEHEVPVPAILPFWAGLSPLDLSSVMIDLKPSEGGRLESVVVNIKLPGNVFFSPSQQKLFTVGTSEVQAQSPCTVQSPGLVFQSSSFPEGLVKKSSHDLHKWLAWRRLWFPPVYRSHFPENWTVGHFIF